jgi:hypothetical protein
MSSLRSVGTTPEKSKLAADDGAIPTDESGDEHTEPDPRHPHETIKAKKTHRHTLSADDGHFIPLPLGHKAKKVVHMAEQTKDRLKEHLEKSNATKIDKSRQDAMDEEQVPMANEEDDGTECTDLILVVHGIGQQLAMQGNEGFNFVYAANLLRQVMR